MSTHKKNCEYHVIKKFEESLTENGQDIYNQLVQMED